MNKNNSDIVREYLKALVGPDKPFRSRMKLAQFLGLTDRPKMSKLFNFLDGTDSSFSAISEWLEKLGGKVVLPGENIRDISRFSYIPKVEAVAGAGATLETSDAIVGYYAFRTDFLGREHISEQHSVLMDVRGDSMEPLLKDGDTVLVDQSDTQPLDGRIYVVTLGDELRVKRIQKGLAGILLRSENPRYADIPVEGVALEGFRIHGRVRWFGRMM